jgi:CheY-like chemotaxis protein
VRDTSIGIPLDFLPHVFERFRQADSRLSREYGGLGLGLAITRELVGLHGGTIDAYSDGSGCGATFRVRLPLKASERQDADAARPPRGAPPRPVNEVSLAGVSVLVVDDDEDALALMRDVLESTGATTITAAGALAAQQIVSQIHVDVIVSDLGMPGMDGFEFMSQIRASSHDSVRGTPALALTAYTSPDDEQRSLESGFQRHLSKPIEPTELVAIVGALSGRRQEERPAEAPRH